MVDDIFNSLSIVPGPSIRRGVNETLTKETEIIFHAILDIENNIYPSGTSWIGRHLCGQHRWRFAGQRAPKWTCRSEAHRWLEINQPTIITSLMNRPVRWTLIFFFQMVTFGSQNAQRVGRILQQSNAEIDGDVPIEGRFVMLTDEPSASHHHHYENNINQ